MFKLQSTFHRHPAGPLHASRSAVPDGDLPALYDHRHVSNSLGILQHLIEFSGVQFYIYIHRLVAIGLTGLYRIGSALLSVNENIACHIQPPDS